MTVYVELVFIENLVCDYFIILLCGRLTCSKVKHPVIAALIGAVYSVLMPMVYVLNLIPLKALLAVIINTVCFMPKSVIRLIEQVAVFLAITSMLYGIISLTGIYTDSVSSFDAVTLIASVSLLASFIMYRICTFLVKTSRIQRNIMTFSVCGSEIAAFADSGNSLYYNGIPVVLVERSAIKGDYCESILVSYSTVGKDGVLTGFLPKKAYVEYENKRTEVRCAVALCDKCFGGGYSALMHPDIIKECV